MQISAKIQKAVKSVMGLILRHSDNQPLDTCHKPSIAVRSHSDKLGACKTY
nr:MAG TPA: hypothetical protein [Caudoviricetes sp.]